MTIREAIELFKAQIKDEKAEHTWRSYSDGLNVFLEYLGELSDHPLEDITPGHFIDYPKWLIRKYKNKRTALSRQSAANYLLDWLFHQRYLQWDQSYAADYKFAKRRAYSMRMNLLPKVIPQSDIEKALAFVHQMETYNAIERFRNIAMIYLMASSGIRVAEVAALRVKNIFINEYQIYVEKAKGDEKFFSPISQEAADAIQAYWDERGWSAPDDPAFARHDKHAEDKSTWGEMWNHAAHSGMTTQAIQYMIRDLRTQAGIPGLTPHKFRHHVGTRIAREFGLQTASQWLHHESIATTTGYSHILDQEIMDAADIIFPKRQRDGSSPDHPAP